MNLRANQTRLAYRAWLERSDVLKFFLAILLVLCGGIRLARAETGQDGEASHKIWSHSMKLICGPYSVGATMRYFDRRISFDQICRDVGFSPDNGTSAAGIIEGLSRHGFHAVLAKGALPEFMASRLPLIICLRNPTPSSGGPQYHFVAALPDPVQIGEYSILSSQKPQRLDIKDIEASGWWTGEAILVSDHSLAAATWTSRLWGDLALGCGTAIVTMAGINLIRGMCRSNAKQQAAC